MHKVPGVLANLAAIAGIAVCAIAGGARLLGHYHVAGYEAMTLFTAGTALMVFAALVKLHLIQARLSGR